MKPLIIIPTYNEAKNILKIIPEIFNELKGYEFSLLIVDDSSTDGTIIEVNKFPYKNIYTLSRPSKMGLATAYIDGIKFGIKKGFDCFIEFDADFSHSPSYLPIMLDNLAHHDVVIGSRNIKDGGVEGWSVLRNIISKGGSLYSRLILNCPIYDLTGGFNGWTKEIIEKIGLDNIISRGYCFQIEMKYRAYLLNADILEFPIIFKERRYGQSKMSKAIFFEAFLNILKLKFLTENTHD